ncbi:hypothetical protein K525DRAFT_187334 [Schizophyllum commune Loenen D]|nr:hypothetical protein K525DRAFT_187334 [Schizophyllum commune Loenen D]
MDAPMLEILSYTTRTYGPDHWEVHRNPMTDDVYYYDREHHILTTDDIRDDATRYEVHLARHMGERDLLSRQPPFRIAHDPEWDVVVLDGKPRALLSWAQVERWDFLPENEPARLWQVVNKMSIVEFWTIVARFPFHRDLPDNAEVTLANGVAQGWHQAKKVLQNSDNAGIYQHYSAICQSPDYAPNTPKWLQIKNIKAYCVAKLMIDWVRNRQTAGL